MICSVNAFTCLDMRMYQRIIPGNCKRTATEKTILVRNTPDLIKM